MPCMPCAMPEVQYTNTATTQMLDLVMRNESLYRRVSKTPMPISRQDGYCFQPNHMLLIMAVTLINVAATPSMPPLPLIPSHKRPSPHLTISIRSRAVEEGVLSASNHVHPGCWFGEFPPLRKEKVSNVRSNGRIE